MSESSVVQDSSFSKQNFRIFQQCFKEMLLSFILWGEHFQHFHYRNCFQFYIPWFLKYSQLNSPRISFRSSTKIVTNKRLSCHHRLNFAKDKFPNYFLQDFKFFPTTFREAIIGTPVTRQNNPTKRRSTESFEGKTKTKKIKPRRHST